MFYKVTGNRKIFNISKARGIKYKSLLFTNIYCKEDDKTVEAVTLFPASLVVRLVKNLPAVRETWVLSLGWEDSLEKEKATHSSILAWRIPWTV